MKLLSLVALRLAWLLSVVLIVLDGLALRMVVIDLAAAIADAAPTEQQAERGWFLYHSIPAVDKFAVLVIGLAALASAIWFDYVYRAAQAKGTLRRRFGVITAIQASILVGCGIVILVL
jgi:hypothetical protein